MGENFTKADTYAKTNDEDWDMLHMIVKHESIKVALIRQENAARTEEDFENLTNTWDKLDSNRERRERRHEIGRTEDMLEWEWSGETVIPPPIEHIWWRDLLKGNPIDVIHDCPHQVQEFTSSRNIYELIDALKENQKEVLYYRAIRYWSFQKIAALRGQTDRNILKTYTRLIESIRYNLYMRLLHRYLEQLPLTQSQRTFMDDNWDKYGLGKPTKKGKGGKKV
ncbi:MAG: hypothetical protein FWE05_12750 [Defluviitaleaceae bacterium]|nr:hypothetical protein [Defluviitaleaceae bacterium]